MSVMKIGINNLEADFTTLICNGGNVQAGKEIPACNHSSLIDDEHIVHVSPYSQFLRASVFFLNPNNYESCNNRYQRLCAGIYSQ